MRTFISFFGICLGISVFLLSLRILSNALEGALGIRLHDLLSRMTNTPFQSLVTGIISTSIIQSSSAVASTMVVFVNRGVVTLRQAFGVILGANIGTTITGQIAAFNLQIAAVPMMVLGLILNLNSRWSAIGKGLFGLGALFFGLNMVNDLTIPFLAHPMIRRIFLKLTDNVWWAVLAGALLTAFVQSSSAVTSVVISLSHLNFLSLHAAVGMVLGSNIGTVITTLLSSIGTSQESRATAYADLIFNVLGVILIMPFFPLFLSVIQRLSSDIPHQIANAHTLFNVITACAALPFIDHLACTAWKWAGIRMGSKKY